jgi:xanthine/CO dehydrogenase XdhC/CoxF family maturation factor
MSIHRLLPLFERARAADQALVLATVIRTGGSTYAKPGAQMLISADGEYAGLLSGGCLEGDLREHARAVAQSGAARIVSYDMRSSHDALFGLGAGCEGAMDILLTRVGPAENWQPLDSMAAATRRGAACRIGFVTTSRNEHIPPGLHLLDGPVPDPSSVVASELLAIGSAMRDAEPNSLVNLRRPDVALFVAVLAPPPRLLLLGGGPDARPVVTLASFLGWRSSVVDHRSSYLSPERFAPGTELIEVRPANLAASVELDSFAAAVVMSHHLDSDLLYLRALARSDIPYVGLLGPAARREKLLADLGAESARLRGRLRAPVGLDIGGRSPESIALAIGGEIHAVLAGRPARPYSEVAPMPDPPERA